MNRSWRFAFFAFVALALALGACASSTDPEQATDNLNDGQPELPTNSSDDAASAEAPDVPNVPGAPLNRFDLQIGQCFNEGSWYDERLDRRVDLTASVACTESHQNEVYHEAEFPAPNGAPFPGDTKMTEWSTQLCYDAFNDFVEAEYEVSTYEIGFIQPTKDTFEHPEGRHRRVFCYLYDTNAETSLGSAQGSGI